jgi:hypothetical protein
VHAPSSIIHTSTVPFRSPTYNCISQVKLSFLVITQTPRSDAHQQSPFSGPSSNLPGQAQIPLKHGARNMVHITPTHGSSHFCPSSLRPLPPSRLFHIRHRAASEYPSILPCCTGPAPALGTRESASLTATLAIARCGLCPEDSILINRAFKSSIAEM